MADGRKTRERFEQLGDGGWREAMRDPGTGDWTERWTLDGERAVIRNTPEGMVFSAGPIPQDHASHAVLWTKQDFAGDVKIEFDFRRLDTINRYVNILYIQATGQGDPPHVEDIDEWADLRAVPRMGTYFKHMNLLHISYAAFGNEDDSPEDYVRARRYPITEQRGFHDLAVPPDYENTGLFLPGETYHVTAIRCGHEAFMEVTGAGESGLFAWDTSDFPPIEHGRIGIRHMWTRCSRYTDFTVCTRA